MKKKYVVILVMVCSVILMGVFAVYTLQDKTTDKDAGKQNENSLMVDDTSDDTDVEDTTAHGGLESNPDVEKDTWTDSTDEDNTVSQELPIHDSDNLTDADSENNENSNNTESSENENESTDDSEEENKKSEWIGGDY